LHKTPVVREGNKERVNKRGMKWG